MSFPLSFWSLIFHLSLGGQSMITLTSPPPYSYVRGTSLLLSWNSSSSSVSQILISVNQGTPFVTTMAQGQMQITDLPYGTNFYTLTPQMIKEVSFNTLYFFVTQRKSISGRGDLPILSLAHTQSTTAPACLRNSQSSSRSQAPPSLGALWACPGKRSAPFSRT